MISNNYDIIPDPQGVGSSHSSGEQSSESSDHTLMKGSSQGSGVSGTPIHGSYSVKDGTEEIMGIAFRKQEQLSALALPEGLLAVGDAVFSYCKALKEVTIPASVEYIGVESFSCSGLESVTFLGTPKVIERNVFLGCNDLKRIIVPKGNKQHFIDCLGKEWAPAITETNQQHTNKYQTMKVLGKDEVLPELQKCYNLRSELQKMGFAVQEELQQKIRLLEQQYIAECVIPALETYSRDLLKDLQCEVTLVIHKDSNGEVKVENKDADVADVSYVLPTAQEPVEEEPMNVPEDVPSADTINLVGEEPYGQIRGARRKFKVILNGQEITGDGATVLAETIRRIGFQRVARLGIMMARGKYNLVGPHRREDNGFAWQREIDGWYVYTNSPNTKKMDQLRYIARELDLDLLVIEEPEVVDEELQPQLNTDEAVIDVNLPIKEQARQFFSHKVVESTVRSYISNLDNMVRQFIKEKIDQNADSIFSYTTVEEVKLITELLTSDDDFKKENESRHGAMTAALKQYLSFIESREAERGIRSK